MTPIDEFYSSFDEPIQGTLIAIKDHILSLDNRLNLQWKYQMPFIYIGKKMFCYTRLDKKTQEMYISFADGYRLEHYGLVSDGRKRFKLLFIDPNEDLPEEIIETVVNSALKFYS